MTPDAPTLSDLPLTSTMRELRRDRFREPGNAHFLELVRRFLPLVYGVSSALIPESAESAENVSAAVFETLAFRWKRIARKTPLASWLVRTTGYVAAKERSRLGLKAKSQLATGILAQTAFKKVNSLSARQADAFVLCAIIGEQPASRKVEKNYHKAVAKVTRAVHKRLVKVQQTEAIEAPAFRSYVVPPAAEVEERIVARISQWTRKSRKQPLVISAISSWQWLAVGRFFRRVAVTFATIVCVLALFAVTMNFLIKTGRVNLFVTFMDGVHKDLLKEFPGLAQPAKPWPTKPNELALASRRGPKNAAELYGMTNIWLAKLKMTPEQWKAAQPLTIPPAPNLPNGKMALRNSKASRSGLVGAMGLDFPWTQGAFEFGEYRFDAVGVRWRGNGTYLNSRYANKQSYKIDVNRVKKGQHIGGVSTLNFVNSIPDFSYMKDALAQQLFRELGAVCPRTSYAYLTIDVPGRFTNQALGLYVLIEDVGGVFAKDRFGDKDAPIFKPVTYDLFDTKAPDWNNYREIYDIKTKATKAQWARVEEFAKLVTDASDEEFAARLPEFLDFDEYAAFVAGHVLTSSYDGYLSNGQNFYMYLDPRSNKFGFIPWDQDHGWGEFGYIDTADHRERASIWKPASYNNRFLARVMEVEAFKKIYRQKLEDALAGPFTVERLYREVDRMAAIIRPAVAAESDFRLQRFEIAISTNWVSGPRDAPKNDWKASEGPRAPAHQIKRFIENRTKFVREQLDGTANGVLIQGW
jgi:hypothetical protein